VEVRGQGAEQRSVGQAPGDRDEQRHRSGFQQRIVQARAYRSRHLHCGNEFLDETETLPEPLLSSTIEMVEDWETGLRRVFADSGQLDQIVLNLAVNPRDVMLARGTLVLRPRDHVVDADTGPLAPGRYVQLSIADSGHRIPADVLEHALDPFFTTKPVGQGTGLGLATVYSIVRRYGGELVISSIVGEVTTIDVYVPAVAG
jgi:hypothetical protein